MKTLLALGAAAVALTAAPAPALAHGGHHYAKGHAKICARWNHHKCAVWQSATYGVHSRHARVYNVGYVFGPRYRYTTYSALPQTYVTQYNLAPDGRYVYRNGYIYVVDPKTYAITQVINALTH